MLRCDEYVICRPPTKVFSKITEGRNSRSRLAIIFANNLVNCGTKAYRPELTNLGRGWNEDDLRAIQTAQNLPAMKKTLNCTTHTKPTISHYFWKKPVVILSYPGALPGGLGELLMDVMAIARIRSITVNPNSTTYLFKRYQ